MSDATAAERVIVSLREVSRVYGAGANATAALRSVTLTVREGEFVAVVGRSGAGKSTLLNILGLLDRPSSGRHELDGVDVQTLGERQRNAFRAHRIGFVFQDSHVLMRESAAENASLGLKIQGMPLAERRRRVTRALTMLGLRHRADTAAGSLSGGERQRVAIARAISTRPTVLLADEPTGALDTANAQRIIAHLRELNARGVTVVVITHDPTVAAAATRQVTLVDGVLDDEAAVAAPGIAADDEQAPIPEPAFLPRSEHPARAREHTLLRRVWGEMLDAISLHTTRPGRAVLLLLAFLLGTGGLVASLGISQSAAAQVGQRLTAASLDEVVVRAGDAGVAPPDFFDRDAEGNAVAAIERLDGVIGAGYDASISSKAAHLTVLARGAVEPQQVFGGAIHVADAGFLAVQDAVVSPTSSRTLLDNPWQGAVAILGERAAQEMGVGGAGPGHVVHLGGRAVDVVGIIADPGRDPSLADAVVLSRAAVGELAQEDPHLVVRTRIGYPAAVAEAIPLAVSPAQPAAVRIETVADLRNLQRGVATDLDTLVGVIAWILLALACLSAATAMYLSVQVRSAEIGLRRALGASRASIWRIFTLEGVVIGAAGGTAGTALGLFGVLAASMAQGWSPVLDPSIVGTGILAGALTGVVSATYPALLAARADPAQAIRR